MHEERHPAPGLERRWGDRHGFRRILSGERSAELDLASPQKWARRL